MLKQVLRQEVLGLLKNQAIVKKAEMDKFLMSKLINHKAYISAKTVATYLPFPFEVETSLLMIDALAKGKRLVVPKIIGQGKMIFVVYDENDLVKSSFGVWEPRQTKEVPSSEIDLIHVPGIVFNDEGYRVGFGGGFYDRYLSRYQGMTISTAYPIQCRHFLPDRYDIAVKEVLRYDETS